MVVRSTRESVEVGHQAAAVVRSTRESVEVGHQTAAVIRMTRMSIEVARQRPPQNQGHSRRISMSFNRGKGG